MSEIDLHNARGLRGGTEAPSSVLPQYSFLGQLVSLASPNRFRIYSVSECWMFYAVPTARVIFTAKTSLDVFSLSGEQVWTFSVLGDRIYEMRCPFVAVGLNARFIVLPHWDNMSQAHMLTHPVTLY